MVDFLGTSSYWQGGFTEEKQKYYEEHRLLQKGKHLWEQISRLYIIARNLCSTYNVTYCFDKSSCCRRYKHLPFQCEYNDNVTISSYVKGNYEFYDMEQIEEFVVFKGAYEIAGYIQNDDAPCKPENYAILGYCLEYYNDNPYITEFLKKKYSPKQLATFLEPVGDEIAETETLLDEKEEESEEQKKDLPSNDSNSLTLTLYDCPPCLPKEEESYVFDFIKDATESYYERGKHGYMHLNNIKFPLYMLKFLKFHLFCLPMLATLCFIDLFFYKIPLHRKWVRLKCVLYLLLDALFCFNSYFFCEHLLKLLSLS